MIHRRLATVIMAAGKGTRMKSDLAKVLHTVNGNPMIHYVIDLARQLDSSRIIAVVGHQRDRVRQTLAQEHIEFAVQEPQLGTGHAVMQVEPLLHEYDGDVLVLSGDVPLLTVQTIRALLMEHDRRRAVATMLTTLMPDPMGYGRVVRSGDGSVQKVVEHKDASDAERALNEINAGIYVFASRALFAALKRIDSNNAQKEYYLPDVLKVFIADGLPVVAYITADHQEISGINTIEQLKEAESILNKRSKEI